MSFYCKIIAFIFWSIALPLTIKAQIDWKKELDDFIKTGMQNWSVPGLSIVIADSENILFIEGYGMRNKKRQEKVTPETIFPVGSLSKSFTATAISLLVDKQILTWDDKLKDHIPGFHLKNVEIENQITISDLLSHRTGLTNNNVSWFAGGFDRKQINRLVSFFEQQHQFRSRFDYNNIMFAYSALLIQQSKQISWNRFVEQEIFEPLGMNSSSTKFEGIQISENRAIPYALIEKEIKEIPYRNLDNIGPSGSINSSAEDLSKWIRFHLNLGALNGKRLLTSSSLSEIHSPQIVIPKREATLFFPEANVINYGFGWFIHDYKSEMVIEHSGNIDGFSSHIALLPDKHIGVAILTNLNANFLPFAIKNRIFDIILEEPVFDWSRFFKQSFTKYIKLRNQVLNKPLSIKNNLPPTFDPSQYAGNYTSQPGEPLVIKSVQDSLSVVFGKSSGVLYHLNYNTFIIDWKDPMIEKSFGPTKLTFFISKSGEVDSITINGIGSFLKIE